MVTYLEQARQFYQEALAELERGKGANDLTVIRDAAEKAWGAVVQATNELIQRRGLPLPQSHRERREILHYLETTDPRVKALGLEDRFMARAHSLHSMCFYDGLCPMPAVELEIREKVKAYIEDVERL